MAIATERSGLRVLLRAPRRSRRTRAADRSSKSWPARSAHHLGILEKRYRELWRARIRSSSRGRRSCSSRVPPAVCSTTAPSGCVAAWTTLRRRCSSASRCERGSHEFFKRYGERFEDSEGKQIFLEFADEERDASRSAHPRVPAACASARDVAARRKARAAQGRPVIDLHTHTTASDGRCAPPSWWRVRRRPASRCSPSPITIRSPDAAARPRACRSAAIEFVPGIEITAIRDGSDVHVLGYFIDIDVARPCWRFWPSSVGSASIASAR